MKKKVTIITDSTVDLPAHFQDELMIDIIPLHIIWGEERFLDNIDITPDQFYNRLPKTRETPTTSQPSAQEFVEKFNAYLSKGQDILGIFISAGLSGTVNSANQAKDIVGAQNIEIIDSKFTSLGTGFQVITAARAAMRGASLEECKLAAEKTRQSTKIYFVVSTLEFLRRGGRIGGASALLGSALDIKPILTIKDGKIEALAKVRTIKKALLHIVELFESDMRGKDKIYVGFSQATAPENALFLKEKVLERFSRDNFVEIIDAGLSPVIGVHAGPGALALSFAQHFENL